MKAITLREPWASLVVNGYKKYEFRSWKTSYRGKILIHAAKLCDKNNIDRFKSYNLNYGTSEIIGEAEIIDCIKVDDELREKLLKIDNNVYSKSGFDETYAFVLTNCKKYDKYIPCRGRLNIWKFDE